MTPRQEKILIAALRRIATAIDSHPEPEDYDDMESAYNNGSDCATYEQALKAREALRQARIAIRPRQPAFDPTAGAGLDMRDAIKGRSW